MIYLLMGHRGVGKTHFLERVRSYYRKNDHQVLCLDLDDEIEQTTGMKVSEIFQEEGEGEFRSVEEDTLKELIYENKQDEVDVFIAVGAGFSGSVPEGVKTIWVRRSTDDKGRIFLDRPRLNRKVSAYEEYLERFEKRQKFYSQCDDVFEIEEGEKNINRGEAVFLGFEKMNMPGILTLKVKDFTTQFDFTKLIERKMKWGISFFELRDDLLNQEQVLLAFKIIPRDKIIWSWRKENKMSPQVTDSDWALELGAPERDCTIVSLHQVKKNIESSLQELDQYKAGKHLKFSPEIESLEDLLEVHSWVEQDRTKRSFLPRSQDGRWKWYRQRYFSQTKLNFFCESSQEIKDQPTLSEVSELQSSEYFSAIIGYPVDHSWTPAEQKEFFKEYNMPVLRLPLLESEISKENLTHLFSMGLRAAAVTSPLKKKVFSVCDELTDLAKELESVNTIFLKEGKIIGDNTDFFGLDRALKTHDLINQNILVWGGGGVRPVLEKALPRASFYSAREGSSEVDKSGVLIWAVGRSRMKECQFPPESWKFEVIFDLNYAEDSPGRELALNTGAKYISGEDFFLEQAKAQRAFWSQYLK